MHTDNNLAQLALIRAGAGIGVWQRSLAAMTRSCVYARNETSDPEAYRASR